ncbi:MAG: HlyC/CorC family transporter [Myxococcales bacterium]|nr:hemolysin family protein [Deltaproteobacteria bacterium]MBT8481631.1 hemolysin family protein [Deltaproteobacteria bacterium]NNL24493.1 HlyC/CorC family transporter [Myxococcales bacterium]RZV52354.1 MAG: HlyC/CorC family transporter [Deltaproteobacteria bacterium]
MDVPSIQLAAAIAGGVGLGALLAAVSAGLHALGEAGLQAASEAGDGNSKVAERVLKDPTIVQSRLLIGRVLCLTLTAVFVAHTLLQSSGAAAAVLAVLAITAGYAFVATLAGAAVRQRSGRATLLIWKWLRPVDLLLTPLAVPLGWLEAMVRRIVPPIQLQDPDRFAELAVEHVIEQGEETGTIAEDHAQMLRSVLEFKNTVAREIMVSRTQVVAFDIDTSIDDVLASIVESGHSRYPVFRGQIDQVEGTLYAKDLFKLLGSGSGASDVLLADVLRKPVFFAAESQKIGVLLREMQRRRSHLAVVVDEFGGAAGIVTLEDIVEEIVGEIQDEHDEEAPLVYERAPGHYFVDASISVYDLEKQLGESICEDKGDFDSLGGMLVHLLGQVPALGETLVAGPFRVVILDADERRVRRVEMLRSRRVEPDEPKAAAG